MPPSDFLDGDPDDTRDAIMQATYRALRAHGYADLTIQKIGDEFSKSKSLLYHHYDGKDEFLVEFLEFMLERFEAGAPPDCDAGPEERLRTFVDPPFEPDPGEEEAAFARALVELRAQAATNAEYRDHFTRSDRAFRDRIAEIVRDGVEEGVFRDVDPDAVAQFVLTAIGGAMTRRATADADAGLAEARSELDAYVDRRLLAEEP